MANKINNRRYSINNRWNKYPKQSLYPTIRQPYTFISWHNIRHVIEMADPKSSENGTPGLFYRTAIKVNFIWTLQFCIWPSILFGG